MDPEMPPGNAVSEGLDKTSEGLDKTPLAYLEIAGLALTSNKHHQRALRIYTESLEAELQEIEEMLELAEAAERPPEDDELDVGGTIDVPGGERADGPLLPSDLLEEDSPFYIDARKRQRYLDCIDAHGVTSKHLDTLAEAVRSENYRIHAYEAQQRGDQAFHLLAQKPSGYFEQNKEGIDWEVVAEKVNGRSTDTFQRTAQEWRIRWLGDRHPSINKAQWAETEIDRVQMIIQDTPRQAIDWLKVAEKLRTNRTPLDCMRHAFPRRTYNWGVRSDARMREAIQEFGSDNWHLVARHVSDDVSPIQCQQRWLRAVDPTIRTQSWTLGEDRRLLLACEVLGNSWTAVCSLLPGRNYDAVKDRFEELTRTPSPDHEPVPIIYDAETIGHHKRWTKQEDDALLTAVSTYGTKRWEDVSKAMGNHRSVVNYRRRWRSLRKQSGDAGTVVALSDSDEEEPRAGRRQGVVRDTGSSRAAIQSDGHASETDAAMLIELVDEHSASQPRTTQSRPRPRPRPVKKSKPSAAVDSDTLEAGSGAVTEGANLRSGPQTTTQTTSSLRLPEGDDVLSTPMQIVTETTDTSTATREPPTNIRTDPPDFIPTPGAPTEGFSEAPGDGPSQPTHRERTQINKVSRSPVIATPSEKTVTKRRRKSATSTEVAALDEVGTASHGPEGGDTDAAPAKTLKPRRKAQKALAITLITLTNDAVGAADERTASAAEPPSGSGVLPTRGRSRGRPRGPGARGRGRRRGRETTPAPNS